MAPTNLDKAEADRLALKDHLEFLETELTRHATTPLDIVQVTMYMEELEEDRKQLIQNHNQIRHSAPKTTDMTPYVQEYRQLCQLATRMYSSFHGIKMSFPAAATPSTSAAPSCSGSHSHQQKIKLPPLELPKFSGNLQDWVSFRDLYTTAVHNSTLTKVEKLTQLKALLTGEAARQVRSIVLSDANYDIAWASLKERYENNRELLFSILRRLIHQPIITVGSAPAIRSLIDTTRECTRSLEVLSIQTDQWDAIILYIMFSKLDNASRELWEQSLPDTSIPTLAKFFEFVEQRARALAASTIQPPPRQQGKPTGQVRAHHVAPSKCRLGCLQPHPLFKCPEFLKESPQQRLEEIKARKLCFNCISDGHSTATCSSKNNCKVCNKRHHTLLHLGSDRQAQQQHHTHQAERQSSSSSSTAVQSHHVSSDVISLRAGMLATAKVKVLTRRGLDLKRSLVDGGSTNTSITESAARAMKLPLFRVNVPMSGLEESSVGVAKFITRFSFKPHFDSPHEFTVIALVVKSISSSIPAERLNYESWSHLRGLQLADPEYFIPNEVDILFGTDIFWNLLENDKIEGPPGTPAGIKSSLGWLVAGNNVSSSVVTMCYFASLDLQLQRFFEQENISEEPHQSQEEKDCEKHFAETHTRDSSGRFTVCLPFKQPRPELGLSKQMAIRRFLSLENKFVHHRNVRELEEQRKLQQHWDSYKQFMDEYLNLNHMEPVPAHEVNTSNPTYYIPHHSVIKESSTTTKLRVVFDASARTSNGVSLNETMMVGPQLQDNLWDIMLRFRCNPIAFIADVRQMYRQIIVALKHRDMQRIVWRDDPSKPIREYRLCTVTYGTNSAPYLAIKCLRQLAVDEKEKFPVGSKIALRDFYVDDTASGSSTVTEAKIAVTELMELCKLGGFELRKWTTNSPELLATIPPELRENSEDIELQHENTVKTLGIYWSPTSDKYKFRISLPKESLGEYSKRIVLSEIARIFDPLGWLAPTIIICKMHMQTLWKENCDWDGVLPPKYQEEWIAIRRDLQQLETITIPRCVIPTQPKRIMLIGCSDASTRGISAAVYVSCELQYCSRQTFLLAAKTKVAPVKHVTLPRLELNGAVLLSELMMSTRKALHIDFQEVRAFTDSTITLHWVRSDANRWKIYIKRRVQMIQDNMPDAQWYHIAGDMNPADCASRGIPAAELREHHLWWNGSSAFFTVEKDQVRDLLEEEVQQMCKEAQITSHHAQPRPLPEFFNKYSTFIRLNRVVAYMFRWYNTSKCKKQNTVPEKGSLTVAELKFAHDRIIRVLQQFSFANEFQCLSAGKQLPTSSSLLSLSPFINPSDGPDAHNGLLRVGGRLRHSSMEFSKKYPILLPSGHLITTCIIRDIHRRDCHSGPSATLCTLQQTYWVINGRDTIRAIIHKCVICARHRAKLLSQMMGDLPPHRVTQSRPFSKVGIDYAGPMMIRPMVRSKITLKCWLAIFVCFATKAIHVEVVSSLSTECFLAALRRFVSRRGKPSDVFSDCGTNFKGADKVLREFFVLSRQKEIQDECSSQHITWHFNPPGAPHFGGLWEAGVKSIKHHLTRVMGTARLTYEEMLTLVTQIEAILNSRPLVPASTDPSEFKALTPAHFLIGGPITALPEPDLTSEKITSLQRWKHIQQCQQHIWRRWTGEYLTRLQNRPKWMKPSPELKIGEMVIIKDNQAPPLHWKLGRVIAVYPGDDGHVRVASIKTADGEMKRPIVKLSLLPVTELVSVVKKGSLVSALGVDCPYACPTYGETALERS